MKQHSMFKLYVRVWFSILIGLLLTILPLPDSLIWFRPRWILIIILFWVVNSQCRVGILTAWFAGILLDLLTGTMLGQHALILVFLTYIAIKIYPRFQYFPIYQQTAIILLLVWFDLVLNRWLMLFMLQPVSSRLYWFSILTSALIWPLLNIIFRQYKNSFELRYY